MVTKGVLFINKLWTKAVSVVLTVLLVFGVSLSVNAQELPDAYSFVLGAGNAQSGAAVNPPSLFDNTILDDKSFTVTVEKTTASSAVLAWSSEELYLSYTVCRYNYVAQDWEELLTTTENTATVDGLSQNTQYSFAVMNGVTGEILGAVKAQTKVRAATVSVVNRSSKQIELVFHNIPKGATVLLLRSTDGKDYHRVAVTKSSRYTDTAVEEATTYYYKVKCKITENGVSHKSKASAAVKTTTLKSFGLPAVSGACKTYAYYTAVTAKSSPQYKLLRSDACYTDPETGIRMVDGYYCVALGSYYGTKIGTKYKITLDDNGTKREINVILCDQKSNRHTDSNHQYARNNSDIVEFYVEKHRIPKGIRGDYGRLEQFSGDVVAIEQYVES